MNKSNNKTYSNLIAIVSLGLSLLALILAWIAYSRTGSSLQATIDHQVDKNTADLRLEINDLRMTTTTDLKNP